MIRRCDRSDFPQILDVINDGARAYKGVIPTDRWKEPYMAEDELQHEIESGVVFWGYEDDGQLVGVMGVQDVQNVTLIRHAYVRTSRRRQGIGNRLLKRLRHEMSRPCLIGTWAAASWAIDFYRKHGFEVLSPQDTLVVLKKYWKIPERQIATSVVLADPNWQSLGTEPPRAGPVTRA
jgi:N-acetylglutamate synthase-like GNAT family acetyltransferase